MKVWTFCSAEFFVFSRQTSPCKIKNSRIAAAGREQENERTKKLLLVLSEAVDKSTEDKTFDSDQFIYH